MSATTQTEIAVQMDQIHQFLEIIQPKKGSTELWFKVGHNIFLKGLLNGQKLTLWATNGAEEDRKIAHQIIGCGWQHLHSESLKSGKGVFYIPTQPQGKPLKTGVDSTDDIGIEIDGISHDEQLARYAEFEQVTGLKFAALLSSGGKSVHGHLKTDQHYPVATMQPIRRALTIALRSDPAVVNVHQPMRFPGFWRGEKQGYQELISTTPEARYSLEELVMGIDAWFVHLGWKSPGFHYFSDDKWWGLFRRLVASPKKNERPTTPESIAAAEVSKVEQIRELLEIGYDEWKAQQEKQTKEREERYRQRKAQIELSGKFDLVEAVEAVCDRINDSAFDWPGHDWQWSGDSKARGCCPWHDNTTGTAGWISNQSSDGRWLYGCVSCFGEKRMLNAFEYWWRLRNNDATGPYPEGKDYAIAARQFLEQHGVTVPEYKPPELEEIESLEAELAESSKTLLCKYNEKSGKRSKMNASEVASILAEEYRDQLAWNVESNGFYRYSAISEGLWSFEDEPFIHQMIQSELDSRGAYGLYTSGYISSIYTLMRNYLVVRHWNESNGLIPFQNGVLELATKKLLPYSPGYRLTWQLPYDYNPLATCEPIQKWLLNTQDGDVQRVQLLRAYLKAIVTGRADLQRFLECIGPAATGKSTFTKLAIALVGLENTHTTTLDVLERNHFEPANFYRKRLVVINDADRYGGKVNIFKSMTGQDTLHFERKNEQARHGFIYDGMVILTANETIQSSDYTSGLERRRLTVPFLQQVRPQERRDLISITQVGISGEFVEYLPGLMNWVLSLPDSEMVNYVRNTQLSVPSLAIWKAESLLESNPMADWVNSNIVAIPDAKTYVGTADKVQVTSGDQEEKTSYTSYRHQDSKLYPNYVNYCRINGAQAIGIRRFSNLLHDLCSAQLHWEVDKHRDSNGRYFTGIELRHPIHHAHLPLSITGEGGTTEMLDSVLDNDGIVTVESLGNAESDGNVGLNCHSLDFQNQPLPETGDINSSIEREEEKTINTIQPVTSVKSSTTNTYSHHNNQHSDSVNPSPDDCLVRYVGTEKQYWGRTWRFAGWTADGLANCADVDSSEIQRFRKTEIACIKGAIA